MATAAPASFVAEIGETAGEVWRMLAENGPMSMAKLVKGVDQSRDTVMLAIGWLAREEKVWIEEEKRSRVVSLR